MARKKRSKASSGKHVVDLGVGFGGLAVAQELAKRLGDMPKGTRVTAIDKAERHVFTPLLYEVASAHVDTRDGSSLKDVVEGASFCYNELFDRMPEPVTFRRAEVTGVDVSAKKIDLKDEGSVAYDVLVMALGSVPQYFGVPGVQEHGLPLKTVDDALAIRDRLIEAVKIGRAPNDATAKIVIAGGGPTGTEIAAELTGLLRHLNEKGLLRAGTAEVHLIHAGETVLQMLHPKTSTKALDRIRRSGVQVHLNKRVAAVDAKQVTLDDGTKHDHDLFVWAGGVKGCPMGERLEGSTLTKKGTVEVDDCFRVKGVSDVFALGDMACFYHPETETPMPALAQAATMQGKAVAKNVSLALRRRRLTPFRPPSRWLTAIPLAGRFALIDGRIRVSGFFAYLVRLAADLRYFTSILPLKNAFRHWGRGTKSYLKND